MSLINILLVEDDAGHARLAMIGLSESGIPVRVKHVENGEEALLYLNHTGKYSEPGMSPKPDLILLDLRMPKVDGFEVLERVKRDDELKNIRIVVLTTSDSEKDRELAIKLCADDYVVKNSDFTMFTESLKDIVDTAKKSQ
ncbi:MAG: response regulator [Spirochaetia bacterium]|nr:response regulator [Spirochaetia bacterium]